MLSLDLIEKASKLEKNENKESGTEDIDPVLLKYINEMIEARREAKREKNFAEADRIRDELLAKGITLLDTREGTKFSIG